VLVSGFEVTFDFQTGYTANNSSEVRSAAGVESANTVVRALPLSSRIPERKPWVVVLSSLAMVPSGTALPLRSIASQMR